MARPRKKPAGARRPCPTIDELIELHEAFLACAPADRPLIGRWLGGYFPSGQYPSGTSDWKHGQTLRPADLVFDRFTDDYERLHQAHEKVDDDFIFIASAYWGIPWLEAILGCEVQVAQGGCRAEPPTAFAEKTTHPIVNLDNNPWLDTLLCFTRKLVSFSDGRFPVVPPLMRGAGDVACAILGGTSFITGFIDDPEGMRSILDTCASTRAEVLCRLDAIAPSWHGTHASGGYPSRMWCRRTASYYQEDSAALLNPQFFSEFLLPVMRQSCKAAEVNFIHLHSSCLYPLDILLEDGTFSVIEINIDHEGAGPSLAELLPTFKKVQDMKCPLILWGEFDKAGWKLVHKELRPSGLSLQPIEGERWTETS